MSKFAHKLTKGKISETITPESHLPGRQSKAISGIHLSYTILDYLALATYHFPLTVPSSKSN